MDAEGKLTKAAEGFAKKNGVLPKALTVKTLDGQDYLGVPRQEKGRLATQVLAELLPVLITDLSLPLAMTWGPAEFRFIRPVHWMVSLFGKQVIRFSCFGKTSGRVSYGHRFLSGGASLLGKAISLASAEDVEASLLKEGKVMLAAKKRRQRIRKDLAAEGLSDVDEALLDEVVYLVEKPTVLCGGFDRKFLSLPDVVLIESMKKHQRYFSVFSQKKILKAGFLCVADNVSRSNKASSTSNTKIKIFDQIHHIIRLAFPPNTPLHLTRPHPHLTTLRLPSPYEYVDAVFLQPTSPSPLSTKTLPHPLPMPKKWPFLITTRPQTKTDAHN
jgi:glycyl-tRNA synthetase beta chain